MRVCDVCMLACRMKDPLSQPAPTNVLTNTLRPFLTHIHTSHLSFSYTNAFLTHIHTSHLSFSYTNAHSSHIPAESWHTCIEAHVYVMQVCMHVTHMQAFVYAIGSNRPHHYSSTLRPLKRKVMLLSRPQLTPAVAICAAVRHIAWHSC